MGESEYYDRGERAYVAHCAHEAGVSLGAALPDLDALPRSTRAARPDAVVPMGGDDDGR